MLSSLAELEELKSADHEETHSEDPLLQPLEPNHFTPKSSEAGNGSRLLILSAIVVVGEHWAVKFCFKATPIMLLVNYCIILYHHAVMYTA